MVQCVTTLCHRLVLIFVNWCIRCGVCWMFLIMLSFEQHYALICLLFHLFLEGGVIFFFSLLFGIGLLYYLFHMYNYCFMGYEPAIELNEWMNEAWNIEYITLFYSRTCLVIILFTKYPLLANVNQNVSNKKGIGFNKFLIVQHNFRNKKKFEI